MFSGGINKTSGMEWVNAQDLFKVINEHITKQTYTCSKSITEIAEIGQKYVQR